jgi:hypothetical protein
MQNQVMQDLAAKRAELEARLLQLQQEQEAAQKEFELMSQGGEKAQEALQVLEQLLNETPNTMKSALFKSLYKALEQEAKRNGINLLAEATVTSNGNGKAATSETGAKRTRKIKDEIFEPINFAVFPNNNRLAVRGFIEGRAVKFDEVYISVDGLRVSPACEASANAWKAWLLERNYAASIKVGDLFSKAKGIMPGLYLMELSDVTLADLSRLVDIDFSKAPDSEENEQRMSREYLELTLLEDDKEPTSEPQEPSEDEAPIQHEEIREAEPVEVVPNAPVQDLLLIGTKFQLQGLDGFEGTYGEIVGIEEGSMKPYECDLKPTFPQHLMLAHEQIQVIPEDDTVLTEFQDKDETEEEEDLNIPF